MAETLLQIRKLVRDLSEQQSKDEISDPVLDEYINNWYQNKFPSEITLGLDRTWRFVTVPYQDKYPVAAEYQTTNGSVRVDGDTIDFFTDPAIFYAVYPGSWAISATFGTGNGIVTTFTGSISGSRRVLPESVSIGDATETFLDNGAGILTGSLGGTGTIVYSSGAVSVTFANPPANGIPIASNCQVFNEGQPQAVLYTNADTEDGGSVELVFRPIPATNHDVQIDYEARPFALPDDNHEPLQKQWGDLIAYGTSIDILERYGSYEQAEQLKRSYLRILDTVLSREVTLMSNNRPTPRW